MREKKSTWVVLLLISMIQVSCRPIKSTRDSFHFNYCHDGSTMGLERRIHLDGYYLFSQLYQRSVGVAEKSYYVADTLQFTALFLSDGTFRFNFFPEHGATGEVGKYHVAGDTIKVQYLETPGGMSWSKSESWFLIIDQSTLKQIAVGSYDPIDLADLSAYNERQNKSPTSLGTFVKYDKLPDPDKNWLKGRKWFWCDEKEFYKWKADMKQKGKWRRWFDDKI